MRRFYLIFGDIVILYLSLFLTLLIRYESGFPLKRGLIIHFWPFTLIFAVWLIVFFTANLYDIKYSKNNLSLFTTFFYAIALNGLITIALFYLIPALKITPKTNFFVFITIVTFISTPWRYYFNKLIARSNSNNNTLIIGMSEQSKEIHELLFMNPQLGYLPLNIIKVDRSITRKKLETLVNQKNVHTMILSPQVYQVPRITNILYKLLGLKINFHYLPDFFEKLTGKIPLGAIDQSWFLGNLSESNKYVYEKGKRAIDLVCACLAGLIILPLLPLIVLAIKLDSDGPVFYRQARVGKAGKIFTLIKFRNMIKNAESKTGPIWASEDDKRSTRVGKFLRRTRIDELPQIYNILKGEMSFIGPRPERPEFHDKLKKEIPFYEERYLIKPGLTGWAQTKFKLDFRGGLKIKDIYEKIQYDLYYIKNRSLLLDLAIVLKTVKIILMKVLRRVDIG